MIENNLFNMPMHLPPNQLEIQQEATNVGNAFGELCENLCVCIPTASGCWGCGTAKCTVYRGPVHRRQWFLQVAHRWFLDRIHGPAWPNLNRLGLWMPLDWWFPLGTLIQLRPRRKLVWHFGMVFLAPARCCEAWEAPRKLWVSDCWTGPGMTGGYELLWNQEGYGFSMLFLFSPEVILVSLRLGLTRRRSVTGILYLNEEDLPDLPPCLLGITMTMSRETKPINPGIEIVSLGISGTEMGVDSCLIEK